MAFEIKSLEVKNSEETQTIEFWAQFGWSLKSSQRVYNKNSHLESRGDSTYSVTETVDFTKIILERDKNMPNYGKITELEEEYFRTTSMLPKSKPEKPTPPVSIEEWAKKSKPDIRSKKEKLFTRILIWGGVALLIVLEPFSFLITMIIQVLGITAAIGGFIAGRVFKKSAIKKAIEENDIQYKTKLEESYRKYNENYRRKLELYNDYDNYVSRLNRIIDELKGLV